MSRWKSQHLSQTAFIQEGVQNWQYFPYDLCRGFVDRPSSSMNVSYVACSCVPNNVGHPKC